MVVEIFLEQLIGYVNSSDCIAQVNISVISELIRGLGNMAGESLAYRQAILSSGFAELINSQTFFYIQKRVIIDS